MHIMHRFLPEIQLNAALSVQLDTIEEDRMDVASAEKGDL